MNTSQRHHKWAGNVTRSQKDNHDYLLIVKDKFGYYGLPGGEIKDGEHPKIATIRELAEETGVKIFVHQIKKVYEFKTPQKDCVIFETTVPVSYFRRKYIQNDEDIEYAEFVLLSHVAEIMIHEPKFRKIHVKILRELNLV